MSEHAIDRICQGFDIGNLLGDLVGLCRAANKVRNVAGMAERTRHMAFVDFAVEQFRVTGDDCLQPIFVM